MEVWTWMRSHMCASLGGPSEGMAEVMEETMEAAEPMCRSVEHGSSGGHTSAQAQGSILRLEQLGCGGWQNSVCCPCCCQAVGRCVRT
jgi:hypothetical protein